MRSLPRARAILLLVALMGGGLGLPVLDALVFHVLGATAVAERQLSDGQATTHSQVCVIAGESQLASSIPSLGFAQVTSASAELVLAADDCARIAHATPPSDALPRAPPQL